MPLLFFLRVNGQKGGSLVSVTLAGQESEHVNTLEWGLSELFEIGLWADVLCLPFDFQIQIYTRLGTGQAHAKLSNLSTSSTYFMQLNGKYLTKG